MVVRIGIGNRVFYDTSSFYCTVIRSYAACYLYYRDFPGYWILDGIIMVVLIDSPACKDVSFCIVQLLSGFQISSGRNSAGSVFTIINPFRFLKGLFRPAIGVLGILGNLI